jgi:hypothetical protein
LVKAGQAGLSTASAFFTGDQLIDEGASHRLFIPMSKVKGAVTHCLLAKLQESSALA